MTQPDVDVAVIGLGPTGAVMAHLLGLCGLTTLVLEREQDIFPLPRAVHFDDEVMRVFQTIGIAAMAEEISRVNKGMRFVDPQGRSLLEWPRPLEVGPQGWYPSYRFHQPDLELVLRLALERRDGVDIRLGHTLIDLNQDEEGVTLSCDGPSGTYSCRARYVVGCDGGRSLVRRKIGGGIDDLGFHEMWLVVDVLLRRDRQDLGDFTVQHCHPRRAATYVRGPGSRRRWEIALADLDPDGAKEPAFIWDQLERWITPDDAEIERAAVYEFHSVIASRWRDRRLFVAGDAAHQMPPFMGQGLCAGVRDAANLAWKIALACRYDGMNAWLDSYQTERRDHVGHYVDMSVRLGRLINDSDPKGALENAFVTGKGRMQMRSPSVRLGHGPWPRERRGNGFLFPQPDLANGSLADEVTGYAPVLFTEAAMLTFEQSQAARSLGVVPVTATDSTDILNFLEPDGTVAVLVRPDRYILHGVSDRNAIFDLIQTSPPSPLPSRHAKRRGENAVADERR